MNSYLKGVIRDLSFRVIQAEEQVKSYETKLSAARTNMYDNQRLLEKYRQQADVEGRIEELGIRAQTVELGNRTLARCKQNKYLREGNQHILSAYCRLRRFVREGFWAKYDRTISPRQRELRALGWCITILSYDGAEKTVTLRSDLLFEHQRIRDEIDNAREGTQ